MSRRGVKGGDVQEALVQEALHLHPELVSDGEGTAASTMLCGRCVATVNRGTKPPLSLAAGHDYGVLRRVLDAGDAVVSIAEQLAESLVRAYPCIVKLSAAQAGTVASVGLVGHVICFPHDAAEVVVATKPLLAEGVAQALSLCLVGPQRLHDLLRRTGQAHPHLLVNPDKVIRRLTALINVNPRYASLNVGDINTADVVNALRGLPQRIAEEQRVGPAARPRARPRVEELDGRGDVLLDELRHRRVVGKRRRGRPVGTCAREEGGEERVRRRAARRQLREAVAPQRLHRALDVGRRGAAWAHALPLSAMVSSQSADLRRPQRRLAMPSPLPAAGAPAAPAAGPPPQQQRAASGER